MVLALYPFREMTASLRRWILTSSIIGDGVAMGKRLRWALLFFLLLIAALGRAAPLQPSKPLTLNQLTSPASPVSRSELTTLLERESEQTRREIRALRPSLFDKALPAIAAIFAALATSMAAYLLQRARLRFDNESAFQKAGVEAISVIKNFRSRQLNEFYAPLQALLKQSHVLRDELYQRLRAAPPSGVGLEMRDEEKAFSGSSLYIQHPGLDFKPFRLIDEMGFIQKQCPHLVPNVAAIVAVNDHVARLLLDKIGLVRTESTELSGVLGQFLAHKSILDEIVGAASQTGSKATPLGYTTAFPRNLSALVAADCEWLRSDLALWEQQAIAWMTQVGTRRKRNAGRAAVEVRPA